MTTIQLEIRSDRLDFFLMLFNSFKSDILNIVKIDRKEIVLPLDIEPIEVGSDDYKEIERVKAENNPSYTIEEVRKQLGL
jgi:hypothetical protein